MNTQTNLNRFTAESTTLSTRILSLIQSILVVTCVFLTQNFLGSLFHEGGHALVPLAHGLRITLFIHPFTFAGFGRPIWDYNNFWTHISGPLGGTLIPLLLFLLLWKRRSTSLLPLLLTFAYGIIFEGLNMIQPGNGDFYNLIKITGLPAAPFLILGSLMIVLGIFFTLSLFPLFGLAPKELRTLIVIPASFLLQGLLGWVVAFLFVPVSPFLQAEGLVTEVSNSASQAVVMSPIIGLLLALIYISLYRWLYPKLPASLRAEVVSLTWKDLRPAAAMAGACVVLGLIMIL
jgi:hypothetical protein